MPRFKALLATLVVACVAAGVATAGVTQNDVNQTTAFSVFVTLASDAPLAAMEPPERFTLVPTSVPAGPARNVAQGYVRLAQAMSSGERYEPGFAHAVTRHALIAAIERSSAEGRAIRV